MTTIPVPTCKYCGATKIVKSGVTLDRWSNERQQWKCTSCGRRFIVRKYPVSAPDVAVEYMITLADTTEMAASEISDKLNEAFPCWTFKRGTVWIWLKKLRPNREMKTGHLSLEKHLVRNHKISLSLKERWKDGQQEGVT